MNQVIDYETVNTFLRNPTLWNEGIITETLRRFKKGNSCADSDFDPHSVQELIKNYLLTLSKAMKKEASTREDRKNEDSSRDLNNFSVSEYDLHYVEDDTIGIAWCDIVFK